MITTKIKSADLPDVKPGMYRGQHIGYTVTIFGAGRSGTDVSVKVEEGTHVFTISMP